MIKSLNYDEKLKKQRNRSIKIHDKRKGKFIIDYEKNQLKYHKTEDIRLDMISGTVWPVELKILITQNTVFKENKNENILK